MPIPRCQLTDLGGVNREEARAVLGPGWHRLLDAALVLGEVWHAVLVQVEISDRGRLVLRYRGMPGPEDGCNEPSWAIWELCEESQRTCEACGVEDDGSTPTFMALTAEEEAMGLVGQYEELSESDRDMWWTLCRRCYLVRRTGERRWHRIAARDWHPDDDREDDERDNIQGDEPWKGDT